MSRSTPAVGRPVVGVAAQVPDYQHPGAHAHDAQLVPSDLEPAGLARGDLVEPAEHLVVRHQARLRSSLPAMSARSSRSNGPTGSRSITSSKKPSTIRRSATSGGTPRLSR